MPGGHFVGANPVITISVKNGKCVRYNVNENSDKPRAISLNEPPGLGRCAMTGRVTATAIPRPISPSPTVGGSSLFCVGGMHNRWVSWFGGLANRVVRGDARH